MAKVNLDNILANYIHRPKLQIGLYPLYAKSDAYKGGEASLDKDGFNSPEWKQECLSHYNSPNNVRRIFIGKEHVHIQYYKPIYNDGKPGGCWEKYAFKSEDNLGSLAEKSLSGEIELINSGFGAFGSYWVMSNIEEIYITPVVLASKYFLGTPNNRFIQFLNSLINNDLYIKPSESKILTWDLPYKVFVNLYCKGAEEDKIKTFTAHREKFPRLRTIAFMSNIDNILELPDAKGIGSGFPQSFDDVKLTWLEYAQQKGILKDCTITYSSVPLSKFEVDWFTFRIRAGIYKFDDEVLKQYSESLTSRYNELADARARAGNGASPVNNTDEKSELEKRLNEFIRDKGTDVANPVIQFAFQRVSLSEKQRVLGEMSKEGRFNYSKLFNCSVT